MCIQLKRGRKEKWSTAELKKVGDKMEFPQAKTRQDRNSIRTNGAKNGKTLSVLGWVGGGAIAEVTSIKGEV